MERCDSLAAISDEPGLLFRPFHSPAMQDVNRLVASWMSDAGLETREDAAFNLIGKLESSRTGAGTFLLGSHLDTVRNAGKYDGPLGVLVALAAVDGLRSTGVALPFHVEILGFSDEEGARYQTTYLGSRAMTGKLTKRDLDRVEEEGIEHARLSARAVRSLLGYAEVHIEQGPMLEKHHLATAAVSSIAGQSRIAVEFIGKAGHAGTTPMSLRSDALCAAAELVLAAERSGVIATVGQLAVEPGASNVIPGHAALTLDIRNPSDARRIRACEQLRTRAQRAADRRGVKLRWRVVQQTAAVRCDPKLTRLMSRAVAAHEREALLLPSGAGHDAAAMASICPVAMLFVRCKGGISHHPDESVTTRDVVKAVAVLTEFLLLLKARYE